LKKYCRWYWVQLAAQVGFICREIGVINKDEAWGDAAVFFSIVSVLVVFAVTSLHVWQLSTLDTEPKGSQVALDEVLDMLIFPLNYSYLAAVGVRGLQTTDNGASLMMATIESASVWECWALWSMSALLVRVVEEKKTGKSDQMPGKDGKSQRAMEGQKEDLPEKKRPVLQRTRSPPPGRIAKGSQHQRPQSPPLRRHTNSADSVSEPLLLHTLAQPDPRRPAMSRTPSEIVSPSPARSPHHAAEYACRADSEAISAEVIGQAQDISLNELLEITNNHGSNFSGLGQRAEQWIKGELGNAGVQIVERFQADTDTAQKKKYHVWCLSVPRLWTQRR
jgi:hypothetical protein